MTRYVTSIAGLLIFAFAAWAQSSSPQHQHVAPNLIDGAVHPELIPDSVAYRLYLVAISTGKNPNQAEQQRQHLQIRKTGLGDSDQQIFIGILFDFRSKYDSLVSEYNESARAAAKRNETTDVQILLRKLGDLVQSTRDSISARLSTQGASRLHSFVVSEKRNMKVTED